MKYISICVFEVDTYNLTDSKNWMPQNLATILIAFLCYGTEFQYYLESALMVVVNFPLIIL